MWQGLYLPDAETERQKLPAGERAARDHGVAKLQQIGPNLGSPHSSAVRGMHRNLRELRPRQGRYPFRAIYARVDDVFVIGAICPEAVKDSRGFERGWDDAARRLADLEESGGGNRS